MKRLALIAALICAPATAGVIDLTPHQTSKMCQTFGNTVVCDSQPQVEAGWLSVFNLEQHRSKKLGKFIASDQCDDARRYALERGDFRLIHNATALCAKATAEKVAASAENLPRPSADMSPYEQGRAQANIDSAWAAAQMAK